MDEGLLAAASIAELLCPLLLHEHHLHAAWLPYLQETLHKKSDEALGHLTRLLITCGEASSVKTILIETISALSSTIVCLDGESDGSLDSVRRPLENLSLVVALVEASPLVSELWCAEDTFEVCRLKSGFTLCP